MGKLIAKDLKIKFIETLNELDDFSYEDGNPFLIKLGSRKYFIFLKNLSPAYFKNSPDITRVQLPYSKHFEKIFKADIPFLILGYDVDTDTIVGWDPKKIKDRLNAKSNVSLYSRSSLQKKVKDNEFQFGYLSNGEKIVLFKRDNLVNFFDSLNNLFQSNKNSTAFPKLEMDEPPFEFSAGKLLELTDKTLLQKIRPLLKKNQVLQAVEITSRYYMGNYNKMAFKDWYILVNNIYKRIEEL